ncbi:hypothetical protein AB6A40_004204 [Gnathostoma spinigerum]|uniref:ubiquitinyl hydrolase 1 n=1 Tax=Gnathostoma spinigerum TaxID=75299 RepID=A0ABD6EBT1_9BILA
MLLNASGEELSPISFGGIYLPLECPPSQCQRSPLVLCYDSSHFSPLVTMRHSPANTLQPIIPITDHYKNLLPLHFAIDPGADFTWWRNEDDDEIANRIELSDADRLSLMSEYMDLIKVDIKRSSFRRNTTSPIIIPCGTLNGVKSLTLNCAFDGKQKPSRIFSEVAQQIKKRLFPGKYASSSKERPELVTITDVRQSGVVVAAKLYSTGHEYMDQMVKSYLSSARQRFEQSKNTPVNGPRQRARLSRSFSTSSLTITCINLHCQQTASKSTNFLCKNCFERQKQLMASFGNVEPGHIRSLRPANISTPTRIVRSVKSNTMPSLSNLSLSSAAHNSPACASTPQASPVHKAEAGVHTVAVHNEKYPSETFTTKVSSVAGADGVTHYYISTG